MNKIKLVSLETVHTHTLSLGLVNEIKIKYKKDSNKPIVENSFYNKVFIAIFLCFIIMKIFFLLKINTEGELKK